jgi:hypothetical protein
MVSLVSMPKPMAAPIASHQRGSPVLSRLITPYATTTHQSRSKETYMKMLPWDSDTPEMMAPPAAMTWAQRFPPRRLTINPVRIRTNPCATAGKKRMPTREVPNNDSAMWATKGVKGGQSTYPQARWRPSSIKLSSSRWKPYWLLTRQWRMIEATAIQTRMAVSLRR